MIKKILVVPIKIYQKIVSPFLQPRCKYYPTCSSYAIQAIEKYGPVKGLGKALWRILRCNPFSHGGVDFP